MFVVFLRTKMDTFGVVFFFFPLIFLAYTALCINTCSPSTCGDMRSRINFPFRQTDQQNYRCGYPGFDLSCNNQNQTVLNLPSASGGGEFIVKYINYVSQSIYINDPNHCLPKRILSLNVSGSPFRGVYPRSFTFINCTSSSGHFTYRAEPISCLSGDNYKVFAMASENLFGWSMPPSCRNISTVLVPVRRKLFYHEYGFPMALNMDLQLTWDEPNCSVCVAEGGTCGFKSNTGLKYGCSIDLPSHGLPRSAKYGIIMGAGIPGLVCIIGLVCFACSRIRAYCRRRQLNTQLPTFAITSQPAVFLTGLDGPTIESFPKTVLGESRRLPKPNDGTCPICLSEYEPKETLRTVPECNHYFHADCIDEWLRMNATCPLCRNSPEGSSVVTPCSSMSLSSSSSAS